MYPIAEGFSPLSSYEGEKYEHLGPLISYERRGNTVLLSCGKPVVQISILAPDLVRVRLSQGGEFGPDRSWAIAKTDWPAVDYSIDDNDGFLDIRTSELVVHVAKSPCRLSFLDASEKLLNTDYGPYGMSWRGKRVKCWKAMPYDEHYFGFGEKTGLLDKRRERMVMWNTDAAHYGPDTDPLYQSIPFFIGIREGLAYGVFFDNSYRTKFDMGATCEDRYSFEAEDGELSYYFLYGPTVRKILERFTELTGRMPLPPRWALGNHQCRAFYYPASRALEVAENFRTRDIPADALWLDFNYMERAKIFTWDKARFPDPERFLSDMKAKGFKVVVIIDPGVKVDPSYQVYVEGIAKDYFCKYDSGEVFHAWLWPGICAFPDFTKEDVRIWWGDLHTDLLNAGVSGIWNDMNEPAVFTVSRRRLRHKTFDPEVIHHDSGLMTPHAKSHNVYALLECRATYEGLLRLRPNDRPFILSRAAYAGIQRYAAVWTGDNTADWAHIALQIPMFLNMGLSGIPFVGSDIGGLFGTPTPELLTRWYQIAALVPFCRNHTIESFDREPWMFGSYYEGIIRRYLKLRYRLLPYLYTTFQEASEKGYPVMRPLLFDFQDDPNTYTIEDEFLIGDALLVAPVTSRGAARRLVYLPRGAWIDYWSHEEHQGPKWMEVEASLDTLPIFVKSGSIIPMQPEMGYVDERPIDPLTLEIYTADRESTYTLYEDDGKSLDYQRGSYRLTAFHCSRRGEAISFTIEEPRGGYTPAPRAYALRFYNIRQEPRTVFVDQVGLPKVLSTENLDKVDKGWFYDGSRRAVHVRIPDLGVKTLVLVS